MLYHEINPTPLLAEYVKCFWVWQSNSKTDMPESPKLLARIIRFQHVFNVIDKNQGYDWPAIIRISNGNINIVNCMAPGVEPKPPGKSSNGLVTYSKRSLANS